MSRRQIAGRYDQLLLAVGMHEHCGRRVTVAGLPCRVRRPHHLPLVAAGLFVERENPGLRTSMEAAEDDLILPQQRRAADAEILAELAVIFGDVSFPDFLAR